uniref:hypothetical protein n=1 Tax=Herbidospora sakaeratensis TaxID=564415 RepID=UPI000784A767|nr:hypothetical protein [Herbidospora sakaeratensis]
MITGSDADCLVRVDAVHLPIAEAVTMVRQFSHRDRAVHDEIVDYCLIRAEMLADVEPLTEDDLRAAADEFRDGVPLRDRAETLAWVAEMGMSGGQFEGFITLIARRRRFRRRKEEELAPAYLAHHLDDFDQVRAMWVTSSQPVNGEILRGLGGLLGCPEAAVVVGTRRARALPAPLRHAPRDTLIGPVPFENGYLTGLVLERRPAANDADTLALAGRLAFTEWLAARREQASVEWHWTTS